jgi:hypothetical protein
VPRSASKRCAAAGFEILVRALPRSIKASSADISFDLPIPLVGCEFLEPFAETGELRPADSNELLRGRTTLFGCARLRSPQRSYGEAGVAIDRFTNRVIDEQIEVVNE